MGRLFASIIILLVALSYVSAQDFEVSPVLINSTVEPGESEVKEIKVFNHNPVKTSFILYKSDFVIDKEGNKQYVKVGSNPLSADPIVTFYPNLLELNPEESGTVNVTVSPRPGDFNASWVAIIIQPTKEQDAFSADKSLTTSLKIGGRIAVDIYHSPGSVKFARASLTDFKEKKQTSDDNRTFEITVTNQEKTFVRGKVYFIAANLQTNEEINLESIPVSVLPQTQKTYSFVLPKDLVSGDYVLSAILDYGNSDSLEGLNLSIKVQ